MNILSNSDSNKNYKKLCLVLDRLPENSKLMGRSITIGSTNYTFDNNGNNDYQNNNQKYNVIQSCAYYHDNNIRKLYILNNIKKINANTNISLVQLLEYDLYTGKYKGFYILKSDNSTFVHDKEGLVIRKSSDNKIYAYVTYEGVNNTPSLYKFELNESNFITDKSNIDSTRLITGSNALTFSGVTINPTGVTYNKFACGKLNNGITVWYIYLSNDNTNRKINIYLLEETSNTGGNITLKNPGDAANPITLKLSLDDIGLSYGDQTPHWSGFGVYKYGLCVFFGGASNQTDSIAANNGVIRYLGSSSIKLDSSICNKDLLLSGTYGLGYIYRFPNSTELGYTGSHTFIESEGGFVDEYGNIYSMILTNSSNLDKIIIVQEYSSQYDYNSLDISPILV